MAIEVRVTRVHAHPEIMMEGEPNRIDPDKWRPLIMSFQQFYGLDAGKVTALGTRTNSGKLVQAARLAAGGLAPDKHVPRRDQAAAGDQDAATAMFALALAKPARIRNAVESSGVA